MSKSREAFRTISEVATWLDTPAHVLRFWESKFSQIKPVKRAGGRRYYRPDDMALLGGIKTLLHDEGMTIKGVQKLLREQGVGHVADHGPKADTPAAAKNITPKDQPDQAPKVSAETTSPSPTPARDAANAKTDDNVVPLSKPVADAPADTADASPKVASGHDADVLANIPDGPADNDMEARPRIQRLLRHARPGLVRRKAAEIAPLVARLEALRDRMARN
ncbi:MAG: MerR family transcriptional regulator [Octadecabacter sp.]